MCEKILDINTVIWDEISMSSSRILELFHAIASKTRGNYLPFGGIQVITVGDWLQLKPVPGKFDRGHLAFESTLFSQLMPHTVQLSIIYRQDNESIFKNVLRELRAGVVSAFGRSFYVRCLVLSQRLLILFTSILLIIKWTFTMPYS